MIHSRTMPVIFSFKPLSIHSFHLPVYHWHCALYACDTMMFHHSTQPNTTECRVALVQTTCKPSSEQPPHSNKPNGPENYGLSATSNAMFEQAVQTKPNSEHWMELNIMNSRVTFQLNRINRSRMS